uniref:Major sperm protein n=1 Tax=Trichuris muris TaxID=70415 RepID=A0A5S6Q8D7_TRIMR
MARSDEYNKEQQLFLLSYVDILPDKIKMHPSSTRVRVALVMVGNATELPMIFRVETTQPTYLKPNPTYGTIEPRGATFIVLYLLKVNHGQFKVRQDKLIVYAALLPQSEDKADPSRFWRKPLGPPKVQAKKVALINYSFDSIKEGKTTPVWARTSPKICILYKDKSEAPTTDSASTSYHAASQQSRTTGKEERMAKDAISKSQTATDDSESNENSQSDKSSASMNNSQKKFNSKQ